MFLGAALLLLTCVRVLHYETESQNQNARMRQSRRETEKETPCQRGVGYHDSPFSHPYSHSREKDITAVIITVAVRNSEAGADREKRMVVLGVGCVQYF